MAGFRLAAVLRARKAQEDAAKAAALRARALADVAATRVRAMGHDLNDRDTPHEATAVTFAATMSARNALASALADAIGAARMADDDVRDALTDLTRAAVHRRTIEKLEERHAAARRRIADASDATAVDDLTTAAHRARTGGSPADGLPVNGSRPDGSRPDGSPADVSPVNGSPADGSPIDSSLALGSPADEEH